KGIKEIIDQIVEEYGNDFEVLVAFYRKSDHGDGSSKENLKMLRRMDEYKGVKVELGTFGQRV
ncbi:MAG: hypothetical protein DRJ64_08905, partial [Thermoprotei archaeon]